MHLQIMSRHIPTLSHISSPIVSLSALHFTESLFIWPFGETYKVFIGIIN